MTRSIRQDVSPYDTDIEPKVGPKPTLRITDAIALIVGIVVGTGIFRTPPFVAANLGGEGAVLLAWSLGGLISLVGAMCYAELASAYPHAGGDYHYITRAFGKPVAFLFAWARMTVIPTGSIAMMAFVFGDYASQLFRLGDHSSSLYAALVVATLTVLNIMGIRQGKWTQNLLTIMDVLGLLIIIVVGLAFATPLPDSASHGRVGSASVTTTSHAAWGLALVFVLLTYGGWNEAAYIAAELRGVRRNMVRALVGSILLIAGLYLLVNLAYMRGLGFAAMTRSEAVAADLISRVSARGAQLISVLIALSALAAANATTFMGARTNYALGQDFPLFAWLGRWHERAGTPINALWVQGAITMALVFLGTWTRKGFKTMVDYTAPVFWLFFLLAGLSLFVLRAREPDVRRPFRVPFYPVTPIVFCASCAYLLYSSLAYTGVGALVGMGVLSVGTLVLLWARRVPKPKTTKGGKSYAT